MPTYVDKPLAYELADSERLVRLAEERGVSLAVGFNRRYAPGYAQCLEHPRELILMQKNRVGLAGGAAHDGPRRLHPRRRHPALPRPGHRSTTSTCAPASRDGLLHHVVLQLVRRRVHRHRSDEPAVSGSAEEILEVSGQDTKREVRNLAEIIDHKGQPSVRRRGDWVPVARQRGIEQSVLAFLDAVRAGKLLSAAGRAARLMSCASGWSARAGAGESRPSGVPALPRGSPRRTATVAARTGERPRRRTPASRRTGHTGSCRVASGTS